MSAPHIYTSGQRLGDVVLPQIPGPARARARGYERRIRVVNLVSGCTPTSAGCDYCDATRKAARHSRRGEFYDGAVALIHQQLQVFGTRTVWRNIYRWGGAVKGVRHRIKALKCLRLSLAWVCRSGDLFEAGVTDDFIADAFNAMAAENQGVFFITTKRPDRLHRADPETGRTLAQQLPWQDNIWLGVSVEDGSPANMQRIDALRGVPAMHRYVEFAPLIGDPGHPDLQGIEWILIAGESAPPGIARPMAPTWADRLITEIRRANGKAYVLQVGTDYMYRNTVYSNAGHKLDQWPQAVAHLKVRESPF